MFGCNARRIVLWQEVGYVVVHLRLRKLRHKEHGDCGDDAYYHLGMLKKFFQLVAPW
jgi:hypothetical protein